MDSRCILRRVTIWKACGPRVGTIVPATVREHVLFGCLAVRPKAWTICGGVCAKPRGKKMKWWSQHNREWLCIFNLLRAYQLGHTAGDRKRGRRG